MYNAWIRSTLRMPQNFTAELITAPPYHSDKFTNALLVITRDFSNRTGVILNLSSTEPTIGAKFDILSPELEMKDVSWGPDGRIYLLRTNEEKSIWRVDIFQLEIDVDINENWFVKNLKSISHTKFIATSLAVQSRLGGLVLGTSTGLLYQKDDEATAPRLLGAWCDEAIAVTKIKRDRFIACISASRKLYIALASIATPQVLQLCQNDLVSTVSFSHELPTLAVGLMNSPPRIRLFEYGWESNRIVATATRELVVFGPSLVEEERWLGGVKDLDFGTGFCVACLFHGRNEPIVFHANSGRRTTSGSAALIKQQVRHSSSPKLAIKNEYALNGKNEIGFGCKNRSITWCGTSVFFLNEYNQVCREGFSRHAAQAACFRNDAVRFAVLGADYCSTLSLEGNPRWTRIDCPIEYVERHGPLTKVAIDDDRSRIAVAGRRGFCVFFA